MICTREHDCSLARQIGMTAALRVWQSFYCDGMYGRCERFKLLAAGGAVPDRLMPNGRLLDLPEGPRADASRPVQAA